MHTEAHPAARRPPPAVQGCWSSFGEYFPTSGGVVQGPKDPTDGGSYIAPRNKAEAGVKKNNTSVVLGFEAAHKRSTYQQDISDPRTGVGLGWAMKPKA
eukprot:SAG22_NODE_137_length_18056_cov_9.974940_5_plen_99_part_00